MSVIVLTLLEHYILKTKTISYSFDEMMMKLVILGYEANRYYFEIICLELAEKYILNDLLPRRKQNAFTVLRNEAATIFVAAETTQGNFSEHSIRNPLKAFEEFAKFDWHVIYQDVEPWCSLKNKHSFFK